MLAMWLARKHTRSALAEIGRHFGRRSHSTVVSAQKAVSGWVATQSSIELCGKPSNVEEAIRRVEERTAQAGQRDCTRRTLLESPGMAVPGLTRRQSNPRRISPNPHTNFVWPGMATVGVGIGPHSYFAGVRSSWLRCACSQVIR